MWKLKVTDALATLIQSWKWNVKGQFVYKLEMLPPQYLKAMLLCQIPQGLITFCSKYSEKLQPPEWYPIKIPSIPSTLRRARHFGNLGTNYLEALVLQGCTSCLMKGNILPFKEAWRGHHTFSEKDPRGSSEGRFPERKDPRGSDEKRFSGIRVGSSKILHLRMFELYLATFNRSVHSKGNWFHWLPSVLFRFTDRIGMVKSNSWSCHGRGSSQKQPPWGGILDYNTDGLFCSSGGFPRSGFHYFFNEC